MKRNQNLTRNVVAGGIALALTACGGGGGGDTTSTTTTLDAPTAALVITDANSAQVAADTVSAMGSMNDVTSGYGSSVPGAIGVSLVTQQRYSNLLPNAVKSVTTTLTSTGGSQAIAAGVVWPDTPTPKTFDCETGTWTRNLYDMDENGIISQGDAVQSTFYDCAFAGVPTQNGTMRIELGASTNVNYNVPSVFTDPWTASFDVDFTNYKLTNSSTSYSIYNGVVTLGVSSDSSSAVVANMKGAEFTEAYLEGSTVYTEKWTNFDFVSSANVDGSVDLDEDFTLASSKIGGIISVNTNPVIHFNAGVSYPSSGTIVITGAAYSSVKVEFDPSATGYWVSVDEDGDTVYETTPSFVAW